MSSNSSSSSTNKNSEVDEKIVRRRHLVLVGGGHAHLQVIKALKGKKKSKTKNNTNLQVTLIDLQKAAVYSGMIPGCVAKLYTPDQASIELGPLCKNAGIEFIDEEVIDIDTTNNIIITLGTGAGKRRKREVPYDIISFDIGCRSRGFNEIPGVMEYTIPTRPIAKLVHRIDEAEKKLVSTTTTTTTEEEQTTTTTIHVVVVGGGAAGIELAMCMRGRWGPIVDKRNKNLEITILTSGKELLPYESSKCRLALKKVLKARNITVRTKCRVKEVTSSSTVVLENGDCIDFTHCLWATGASAHPLATKLKEGGIKISTDGWIVVNDYLQSQSHSNIFAAGDCCTIEGMKKKSPPKAGVYAVRSGPILIQNLLIAYQSNNNIPMQHYIPQDDFLKLLACGDGKALGFRFGIPFSGKWVFKLKDYIDQKFMNLFRESRSCNI